MKVIVTGHCTEITRFWDTEVHCTEITRFESGFETLLRTLTKYMSAYSATSGQQSGGKKYDMSHSGTYCRCFILIDTLISDMWGNSQIARFEGKRKPWGQTPTLVNHTLSTN